MRQLPSGVRLGITLGLALAVAAMGFVVYSQPASAAETVASGIAAGTITGTHINSSVAGDGIQGGGGSALAVDVSDFAGTGLEDDGSENLRIAAAAAGDGIQGGAGSALAVDASDFAGTGLEDDGAENLRIAAAAAGDGLSGGGGSALAVNVDDSSIEINTDTLRIKAGGVTNDMLAGSHTRAKLITETSARYQLPLMSWRDYDGSAMKTSAESPTTSDFYIVAPGMGAGTRYIRGADAISNTKTSTTQREFCLPPEYVAGTDIELNIHARYTGAGTAGTKTIDAEVYELTDAGAVGADLNEDGIEDLTAGFADTAGFTIDGSGLAAGDMLMLVIQAVLQETVGSDTIHVEIGSIELQLSVKG